ncbi:hypothetical protein FORC098_4946 [Salmonella enterica subsp. enterica serovar Typhimurium]|uniref:Uncharacterized protein n=3 Tax=Salmonella enterica I TaxID=59201 RepID=A0A6C8G399_SALIN|nr:hypothetical protein FORC20_4671 [Salmonella enterica subsp. enterica serovar Typhimurium]ATD46957.1 hypothetical protein FORC51_4746 [Salmonella enterica]EFX50612.1 hypothetical protein SEE_01384 [Salmonella enterica subsp. enterica serovar Typhimurium str. TN061786]EHB40384.1 hypothetical protein SEENIN0B_04084 [Salmonella enterica subsp. enterica serovar Infantis str. SARB27]EPI66953.1 hypothetical protein A673_03412 [Salmonella enterica subsp. enterica serovar Enteritidis str. 2009K0958]
MTPYDGHCATGGELYGLPGKAQGSPWIFMRSFRRLLTFTY